MKHFLFTDGASVGNGGDSGAGFLIKDHQRNVLREGCKYLGEQTNNFAEYTALILGMELALEMGIEELVCCADSNLIVQQMKGDFEVKTATLRPLKKQADTLAGNFKFIAFEWIPREENAEADALSEQAIADYRKDRSRTDDIFSKYSK